MSDYLQFWGKTGEAREREPGWHPLAYHSLDVAAAAQLILQGNPRRLSRIAHLLGTDDDNALRVVTALIALHDVGKFAEAFQCKSPENWPTQALGPVAINGRAGPRHDQTSWELRGVINLGTMFGDAFSQFNTRSAQRQLDRLWFGVAAHHGQPVAQRDLTSIIDGMSNRSIAFAIQFAADIGTLIGPFEALSKPEPQKIAAVSWAIAGLTNLADWIGSNRNYFRFEQPSLSLDRYWLLARERALVAVKQATISPQQVSSSQSISDLFPSLKNRAPSPLQLHASQTAMPEGPLLAIVEDVTGSGKTEAAIVLAARLMASGQADGIFFALPTMATANAMYERLSQSYRLIFHEGAAPSLVLAHGRRKLNKGFAASILENSGTCEDTIGPTNGVEAAARGDESSAACAAWIADDRRKSFLAHVGVGTIDQCFLGVLPSKHQSLRLWGLASKVLIVDEAHAYDAYMGRELERLLEFHAALGGSAIVLSATLPSTQRARLAQAFGRGLGRAESVDQDDSYPLMTTVSATGTRFNAVATREDRRRSLMVRTVPTFDDGLAHVVAMAHRGSAVAWIRNSVDDAIDAVTALRAANLAPILLHARFAMGDRLRIEDEVRITLGPDGDQSKRQGYVLVGTQILEQSLDYDVDAMVTDLAPIDLIIQRAGRLWRHADRSGRPTSECELVVIAPDWKNVENPNWYHQVSPRAAAVYRHHGLIWRGAKVLAETGAIVTPEGVRTLVASVYDHANDDMADIPDPLLRASRDAMGKGFAAGSIAEANLLEVDKGYGGTSEIWSSDVMTPTRLGDPVTVFRLGQVENGQIVPWCRADDGDIARSWALSEVSLSRSKAIGVPEPEAKAKAMILIAKQQWPEWEHDQPLLVLTLKGTTYVAEILDSNQNVRSVIYSKTIGLQIAAT